MPSSDPISATTRTAVATNAIAWELYATDGRQIHVLDDGAMSVDCTPAEAMTARRIAERVIDHLDQFDRR
jgi:hypothetical protein